MDGQLELELFGGESKALRDHVSQGLYSEFAGDVLELQKAVVLCANASQVSTVNPRSAIPGRSGGRQSSVRSARAKETSKRPALASKSFHFTNDVLR